MEQPTRKPNRLEQHHYTVPSAYFITICTENREKRFWSSVGAAIGRPQEVPLSPLGSMADRAIQEIPRRYPAVTVDHYVIMPNHIHLLLQIHDNGAKMPSISTVVQQMKGSVTKQAGRPLWQKGFYDHIIRSEQDYQDTWNYIEGNPSRWMEDKHFVP